MITICGGNKGGSTKTTTATNIAEGLAQDGHNVCLLDADRQRTASKWYESREAFGGKMNFTLRAKYGDIKSTLRHLDEQYDHVIVDVAGHNSEELITGMMVAHLVLAPSQCSQFDLDALEELQVQTLEISKHNPALRVLIYQTMASTHAKVKPVERAEFLAYLAELPALPVLESFGCYRKYYKDVQAVGKTVLEGRKKHPAALEIRAMMNEVYNHA